MTMTTKIKLKLKVSDHELDCLHDVIMDATGHSLGKKLLIRLIKKLPDHIKGSIISWGLNDTEVREQIYDHLRKQARNGGP